MIKKLILLICIFLSSCVIMNETSFKPVDLNEKTVTVPVGTSGVLKDIKQYLSKNGWKTAVFGAPKVTEGKNDDGEVKLKTYDTFHTRYTFFIRQQQLRYCFTTPYVNYDITLVDNSDSSEVFSISGETCEDLIWDEIKDNFTALMEARNISN